MKFRSLRKWKDIDGSIGLIFVAQLIDELLFEYTLDTYKPSAMNTSLLIIEAQTTINAIKRGSIKKPNLRHILSELCVNLKRDEVANSLISVDLNGVLATLKNSKSTDDSVRTTIGILLNQVPLDLYKEKNEQLLIKQVQGEQDISKLRSLTRSYITTLLNFGYSSEHIKKQSRKFFFSTHSNILNKDAIVDYLAIFSEDLNKYNVIYRAPKYLGDFNKTGDILKIKILDQLLKYNNELRRFDFNLRDDEVYLFFEDIEAKDIYSAKKMTDKGIELLQTLIGLFHHKETPEKIESCLIHNTKSNEYRKVVSSVNPMHRCADLKTGVAARKMIEFLPNFNLLNKSFRKFNRSAVLHTLALSSESKENQMINLWIALESLIPNKPEEDEKVPDINHIISSIIPFLNLGYINKIVTTFSKDLWRWDSRLIKNIMKNVEAEGYLKKISHFLSLDKYEELRGQLEESFKEFYLLSDRYDYLKYLYSSPNNIAVALDNHTQRVEWQIRRIYRARNLIVHDGVTPSYTNILIENTHDYLDSIMNTLMVMASSKNTLNTISQGFKMIEINYTCYYKSLSEEGVVFNQDNIDDLLFKYPVQKISLN